MVSPAGLGRQPDFPAGAGGAADDEPEEIANLVVYLSSPFASATTGAAVRVDGEYVDSIVP